MKIGLKIGQTGFADEGVFLTPVNPEAAIKAITPKVEKGIEVGIIEILEGHRRETSLCKAETKSGTQCKNNAVGGDYCQMHDPSRRRK